MISDVKNYAEFICNRGLDNKGSIISQILKNERLKRKMTLEELSKGICSISYLSKLENYNIHSKQTYIRELFEKMDINYDDICINSNDGVVEECLKNYFYGRVDNIISSYESLTKVPESSTSQFIKCFYYLVKSDLIELSKIIGEINSIKYTLSGNDGVIFIYLATEYLILKCDYNTALEYLKALELLEIKQKVLNYLILENNIIVSFNLKNSCRLFESYKQYELNTFVGYPAGRRLKMKMIYNTYICKEFPETVFEDLDTIDYEQIPCDYRFDVLYYQYLIKLNFGNYNDIFDDIVSKGYYLDTRFVGILAYLAYKIHNKLNYDVLLNIMESTKFQEVDKIHQQFTCFVLLFASSIQNENLASYLRTEVIPYLDKEVDLLYNEVYKEVFIDLLVNDSKYKEAFYSLNKFTKKEMANRVKYLRKL